MACRLSRRGSTAPITRSELVHVGPARFPVLATVVDGVGLVDELAEVQDDVAPRDDPLEGEAVDVQFPGALVIETGTGREVVSAGDCEHLRPLDE